MNVGSFTWWRSEVLAILLGDVTVQDHIVQRPFVPAEKKKNQEVTLGGLQPTQLMDEDVRSGPGKTQNRLLPPGRGLHDGGEEGLRVEESCEPDHRRQTEVCGPRFQLLDPGQKVCEPQGQTGHGRVGSLGPLFRNRVQEDGVLKTLHVRGHSQLPLKKRRTFRDLRNEHTLFYSVTVLVLVWTQSWSVRCFTPELCLWFWYCFWSQPVLEDSQPLVFF